MILIIGLGNPGPKFNRTRHNAGFEALDFFAAQNNFPEFTLSKKYDSLVSEKYVEVGPPLASGGPTSIKIILVKPQTFMNDSGRAVKLLTESYRLKAESLVVVHDEIDLPVGSIKISKDSGAAGHKGVASIINTLGTKDFTRIKIGVSTGPEKAEAVVLEKFSPEEYEVLQQSIQKAAEMLKIIIDEQ